MFGWLKTLLGGGESSGEVVTRQYGDHEYAVYENGQCEHTDVEDQTKVRGNHHTEWHVQEGRLIVPQTTYDIIHCNQCDSDLAWSKDEADTLVFEPSFTFAPDVDLEEALDAHEASIVQSLSDGSILINREENPADDQPAAAGGPTD